MAVINRFFLDLTWSQDQAPDVMRSCSMALGLLSSALGSYMAGVLTWLVQVWVVVAWGMKVWRCGGVKVWRAGVWVCRRWRAGVKVTDIVGVQVCEGVEVRCSGSKVCGMERCQATLLGGGMSDPTAGV